MASHFTYRFHSIYFCIYFNVIISTPCLLTHYHYTLKITITLHLNTFALLVDAELCAFVSVLVPCAMTIELNLISALMKC